jgi:TolB protein
MLLRNLYRFGLIMFLLATPFICSQEKPAILIRPTPKEEMIIAAQDLILQNSEQTRQMDEALRSLNQTVWDDLMFAGYFSLASKTFYPHREDSNSQGVDYEAWSDSPLAASYLSTGYVDIVAGVVRARFQLFDIRQHSLLFSKEISGNQSSVRAIAHRWADEVVYALTAGASRGIASTQIAYSSQLQLGAAKDVCVMDYDGYNQRTFIQNGSLNLFPNWSVDNSKICLTSDRSRSWEIYIYSYLDGSRIAFPTFNSFASTPSLSPDRRHIAFALRSTRKDADIFISKLDGSDQRNITNNPADETSPTWAPSGRQIAFASNRNSGSLQIYICDSDGANVRLLSKEKGEADSPSWSPDGEWIAFQWKPRKESRFDIYIADPVSGQINQLTSSAGNNVNPSWAPDARHIAFESDRTGSSQIYIMALGADMREARMITSKGSNTAPAWSNYSDK